MIKVVIAGGTGMIGRQIEKQLDNRFSVFHLTRNPRKENHIFWNPKEKSIEQEKIQNTQILINLCGENIAAKRWTKKRKKDLYESRIGTTRFLFDCFHTEKSLEHFITASGINCYPLSSEKTMEETDAYGSDYLSKLVEEWEAVADLFARVVPVSKMRIAMVLDSSSGALPQLLPLVKKGVLSPLGSGEQWMSWVHLHDLASAFSFVIEHRLEGVFNVTGHPETNASFTEKLMIANNKKKRLPNVPSFVLKLILGQRASLLLTGTSCSNLVLKEKGFQYQFEKLEDALNSFFS